VQTWISKESLVPLQMKMWLKDARRTKLMQFSDVRKVDGIWVPHNLIARVLRDKDVESTTVVQVSDVKFNVPEVSDGEFTLRRLEQGL